jgi:uncharacterized protein (TIGR03435 family)
LKLRRAVKELPVYELAIERNGPKLKQVANDAEPLTGKRQGPPRMRMPMEDLVSIIAIHLDRQVVDKTGLSSKIYDFQFDQVALSNCQRGDEALDCVSPKLEAAAL